jgi:hypothetical protein
VRVRCGARGNASPGDARRIQELKLRHNRRARRGVHDEGTIAGRSSPLGKHWLVFLKERALVPYEARRQLSRPNFMTRKEILWASWTKQGQRRLRRRHPINARRRKAGVFDLAKSPVKNHPPTISLFHRSARCDVLWGSVVSCRLIVRAFHKLGSLIINFSQKWGALPFLGTPEEKKLRKRV